ncbi:MAG: hypothetical protein EOP93_24645, partial [Lysobacteraceae bacterium]
RVMGQSADRDHDHVDVLSRRQASERIALFLHGLGERYHRIGQSGDDFHLPMSRDEIARYLGLALETVSRGFSRLHEEGVIEVRGRRVRIIDAAALHAVANGCEVDSARGAATTRPDRRRLRLTPREIELDQCGRHRAAHTATTGAARQRLEPCHA